jgi:hypothetical protein
MKNTEMVVLGGRAPGKDPAVAPDPDENEGVGCSP